MSRAARVDAILAAVLLPLWVAAFTLHVDRVAHGRLAWVGVFVSDPASDAWPLVTGMWEGTRAPLSGLRPGDELLGVGDVDLRGVGPVGFFARALEQAGPDLSLPVAYRRDGVAAETRLELSPVAFPWRSIPLAVAFVVTGSLVLFRRPGTAIGRAFFLAALALSLHWMFFFGGSRALNELWVVYQGLTGLVLFPLMLRPVLLFPEEVAPPDGRLPWWPWLFAVFGPVATSWAVGVPFPHAPALRAAFVLNLAFLVVLLGLLTRNFRRSGARGRRQLRWVLFGFYVGTAPMLVTNLLILATPRLWWLHEVAASAMVLLPVCVLIAIVRENLFDIDRLISAATAYSILSVVLLAALLTVVPWLAEWGSAVLGAPASNVQLVLSVALAGGLVPGQRALRPWIDRTFFSERHALERGFRTLLEDLDRCSTPQELFTTLGERLEGLLRPQSVEVYGALDTGFGLVLANGVAVDRESVPAILEQEDDAAARAALAASPAAARDLGAAGRRAEPALIGPEATERLRRAGVALLLPLRRGSRLAGLVGLGEKRSLDVYTSGERALLAAVAEKASDVLARFDDAEILRQERAMRDALRRYVPMPVADRLTSGRAIEDGERELSVLFVDVRGYSGLTEGRRVGAVFSMVSRMTETVSEVIRRHGGTVVEFLGDGVMAMFGAPDPLDAHARAALAAGRDVVRAVRDLDLRIEGRPDLPISVGVGIATGRAFVGSVETGDRLVYTAVGETVNLASRLQGLTRELEAGVAVDSATRAGGGELAAELTFRGRLPIRGTREPAEVYTLA